MKGKALYIFSADCKDLMIPQYYSSRRRQKTGHSMLTQKHDYNLRRFSAALDYSLDQIHLREVYEQIYGDTDFSFQRRRKQYTTRVVNVTFKYSVRAYNNVGGGLYVKLGLYPRDLTLTDGVALRDGELEGILLGPAPPPSQETADALGPYFTYEGGAYKLAKQPPVVVTTAEARKRLYEKGFWCDGVHFIRWKRSSGSARVGKCLFIDEALYDEMHRWEMCGLDIRKGDAVDLAALESYISLPSSSIIDLLELGPENILVIDDYESVFNDEVVSVEEHDGRLTAERKVCEVRNSIWDGQGLIDRDAMGLYSDKGMILLRNLFFKCCCFNCNLQQWFRDHGITEIGQLHGRTKAQRIEDIKLVTTPSSIKYLKFGTLDDWLAHIEPAFGVVKYDKKTHFFDGRMVQIHYQLLNTLHMTPDEVKQLLQPTFDYMDLIRNNPAVLRYHIRYPIDGDPDDMRPAQSKNDVVFKMLGINDQFAETKLYDDFKSDILKSMTKNLRLGHVLVNGNYSVLCGNPIEMLCASIGQFDGMSQIGIGNVHTTRFPYNRVLLGSRSPHVSMGNVFMPMNAANAEIDRYMNPTDQIVYINSITESVLDRLSGADFDSDTMLLTDNDILIHAAEKYQLDFPVAAYNVVAQKIQRHYTTDEQCDLDIKTSRNLIGEIVNTSAELNTLIWDAINRNASMLEIESMYLDVCLLNVLSNIEIDKAKKEFNVDSRKELSAIQAKYKRVQDGKKVEPNFFAAKDRGKGYYDAEHKLYAKHETTMDYLQTAVNSYRMHSGRSRNRSFVPFGDLVEAAGYNHRNVWKPKVARAISLVRQAQSEIKAIYADDALTDQEKAMLSATCRQDCIDYVGEIEMTTHTMIYLLKHIESEEYQDARRPIFNTLFGYPNSSFYELIRHSARPVPMLVEDPDGPIHIFDFSFTPVYANAGFSST